jgi:hypothetical protein
LLYAKSHSSERETRQNKAALEMGPSDLKILAMSGRGAYVLVQVKDIFQVLPSKQCPEGEMPSRGTFSSQAHKERLMDAAYQDISPCLVLTPNKTIKLIVYNLGNWGTQWLTYKSFRDVLEMKERPDVDEFKKLLKELPTGVDSGRIPTSNYMGGRDAEVGVSRQSNIKSESLNSIISMSHFNVRAFENLFIKYYEFPQKPTPEQLDYFGESFPLKRFIELEKSELEFLSNTSPIKIRYEKWLEIHARALHALISLFSKHNVSDVRNANDHLLKLWKFLPLNPSPIASKKSLPKKRLQKIHATWFMEETTLSERKKIDEFLNALVQKSECLLDSKLPFCGGEVRYRHHFGMVDIGAYQLLLKRHLLETPLRLWPLIFKAAARPEDYDASLLASSVESTWEDGSRVVVECEGNGGYEVSRLWSSMVDCEFENWCIKACPLSWEYEFRMYHGFSPPASL